MERFELAKPERNVISLTDVRLPELRAEITDLRERLEHVTDIFVENEASFRIVAHIALAVQACNSLQELDHTVGVTVVEQSADHARLFLDKPVIEPSAESHIQCLQSLDETLRAKLATLVETKCEASRAETYESLLGVEVEDPASVALIPVAFESLQGVLVIGSKNPDFYANDVGSLYLDFLGASIARSAYRILVSDESKSGADSVSSHE